eukprot:c33666_g1_i1.p1 GENE.c33666_g1_i1~~c33666_g1_i1.p1  ORF type:complete len:323 (-),score=126.24 c33666_g1_i1:74-1042(-)
MGTIEEYEAARQAIMYARALYANSSGTERFSTPKLGTGPGEFATTTELEAAKRALAWARQQYPETSNNSRLLFETSGGNHLFYDGTDGNTWGQNGSNSMFIDSTTRFPSPVLGLGAGEYATLEELEAAKKAVYWARNNYDPSQPERFPSPKLGVGPGEYATPEEIEAAKRAITWARQQGQIGIAQMERLRFETEKGDGVDKLYDVYRSDFDLSESEKQSAAYVDTRKRFPSPVLGLGPGEYSTVEELELAKKMVAWKRAQQMAAAATPARFQKIQVTVGPGDYKSEAQLEQESKEAYWARLRALEEIDRYYTTGIDRFDWWG